MMIFNLCIGTITPPVGTTLFVGVKVGQTKIENVIKQLLGLLCSDLYRTAVSNLCSDPVHVAAGITWICLNRNQVNTKSHIVL